MGLHGAQWTDDISYSSAQTFARSRMETCNFYFQGLGHAQAGVCGHHGVLCILPLYSSLSLSLSIFSFSSLTHHTPSPPPPDSLLVCRQRERPLSFLSAQSDACCKEARLSSWRLVWSITSGSADSVSCGLGDVVSGHFDEL